MTLAIKVSLYGVDCYHIPTSFEIPKDYSGVHIFAAKGNSQVRICRHPEGGLNVFIGRKEMSKKEHSRCLDWIHETIEMIRGEVSK